MADDKNNKITDKTTISLKLVLSLCGLILVISGMWWNLSGRLAAIEVNTANSWTVQHMRVWTAQLDAANRQTIHVPPVEDTINALHRQRVEDP